MKKTGWDVRVDGDNIDAKHHDYYHGYALEGRKVRFDDHADADHRRVTINGTVNTPEIEIAAEGYEFVKGTNGAIAAGADMVIRSGAGLHSEVELNLGLLSLEAGASLSLAESVGVIKVSDEFRVEAPAMAAFSMRSSTLPAANIDADLDLTDAAIVVLEASVDMNGHTLLLNRDAIITLRSDTAITDYIPFFTNVGMLEIEGIGRIANGTEQTEILNVTYTGDDSFKLIYTEDGSISQMIPEPATTTLSLLGICGLAIRRRRK